MKVGADNERIVSKTTRVYHIHLLHRSQLTNIHRGYIQVQSITGR